MRQRRWKGKAKAKECGAITAWEEYGRQKQENNTLKHDNRAESRIHVPGPSTVGLREENEMDWIGGSKSTINRQIE